jgi:hypothetical protein
MSKQQWVSRYAGIALSVLLAAGCGDAGKDEAEAESAPAASAPATAAPVRTASAPADACGWIPAAEAAAIVGPLEGAPVVVRSLERPDPDPYGPVCLYALASQPRVGRGAVLLQVDLSGGIIEERVSGSMVEGFRQIIQAGTSAAGSPAPAAAPPPPGWDRVGKHWIGFNTFFGRIGHVAVSAMALTPEVPSEKTAALATRVRDALPDLPFLPPRDPQLEALARAAGRPLDAEPSGPDPCALLSAEQAEQVLGKLVVPPYRSAGDSPLAVRNGEGCSYFTAGHRAFTIYPHWDTGKMIFGMAKGVGGVVGSVAPDDTAAAADTLEGPWEEAAANGTTGQLYFLKGDRMLEVNYVTSSTDRAGAVRLARSAVEKL